MAHCLQPLYPLLSKPEQASSFRQSETLCTAMTFKRTI
jgi:hypothetical protein